MTFQLPQYWQLALDGLQILLCLLILFFFVATRTRNRHPAAKSNEIDPVPDFNARVFAASIRQQTDQAFDNILTVIAGERRNLDRLLQLLADRHPDVVVSSAGAGGVAREPDSSEERLPDDQLKAEVKKLADAGRNAGQISRQMKIPVGEVELILNLTKDSA